MIKIQIDEINRWYVEIQQAERFRDEQFGVYTAKEIKGVGENIQYVDYGMSSNTLRDISALDVKPEFQGSINATINICHPIVKNIIPSLYYRYPKVISMPKRIQDQDSSPVTAQILNYYQTELNIKDQIQLAIFDAYVLGVGIIKIGYATQFGADIPDEEEIKRREEKKENIIQKALGLLSSYKEKKLDEMEAKKFNMELNEFIRSESPYVEWVNPFNFLIDPRANSIYNASWICHMVKKTLKEVKSNPNYSNTQRLNPSPLERIPQISNLSDTQIENFQTIDLYEIHYKTDKGINILTLAKDQDGIKPLRHEESIYEMDGFQFELLMLNKHGHKLYPRPDISIIKGLQDRLTVTFDSILDQVDRFVTKIFVDESALATGGMEALEDGKLGSVVKCNKNPNEVVRESNMVQVKADMAALIERIVDIISLEVGLTRAQLTGLSSAETATGENIAQGGVNLRRADQSEFVIGFVNRINRKLWQVITQFVDLEELQLISGEPLQTPTGELKYNWTKITPELEEKLIKGEYSFDIEVGSAQKPNIEVIRQQAINLTNMLFNPVVRQQLNAEGRDLRLAEVLKRAIELFPEWIKNPERVLPQATEGQKGVAVLQGLQGLNPSQRGISPENTGAMPNMQRQPPTKTTMMEEVMGEQGGGVV